MPVSTPPPKKPPPRTQPPKRPLPAPKLPPPAAPPKPPTIRVSFRYNKNQEWVGDLGWSTTDATSLTINGYNVNVNGGWKQYRMTKGKALYFVASGPRGTTSLKYLW